MRDPFSNPWRFDAVDTVYDNPWIKVEALQGLAPSGERRTYAVVRFQKHAVGVLPIDREGHVHLVGQWRVPLGRYSWEMPEGGVEQGEDIEHAARRECEEEAGVVCGRLLKVLEMDLSNSVSDEMATCFLAFDLSEGAFRPDPTEVFQHRRIPFMTALGEAVSGEIRDSLTVATLLRAHHMAVTGAIDADHARAMLAG
jgi:8-oxo-dGTP pyrophosphatase MutT (NUDIX family)